MSDGEGLTPGAEQGPDHPPRAQPRSMRSTVAVERAIAVTAALVVVAFFVLLVDLVRQRSWLDVVLLLVGGALVTVCFLLQRWSRPPTG